MAQADRRADALVAALRAGRDGPGDDEPGDDGDVAGTDVASTARVVLDLLRQFV